MQIRKVLNMLLDRVIGLLTVGNNKHLYIFENWMACSVLDNLTSKIKAILVTCFLSLKDYQVALD